MSNRQNDQIWLFRKFDTVGELHFHARFKGKNVLSLRSNAGFANSIKFADSSHGADKIEKAVQLARHIGTSPIGEFLSNISELNTAGEVKNRAQFELKNVGDQA